jgi:hypothetical protein
MYTLQGKTQPTCHTLSTLSSCMAHDHTYLKRSTYSNLSYSRQQIWTDPLHPRRKGSRHNPPHDGHPIHGSVPSFSPTTVKEQWGKVNSCWQPTTRLTGPISPACDRYVQYLLAGANRTVLNQHRWGLQPWRCRLATYPLSDLLNQLFPLSPNGPARSPF